MSLEKNMEQQTLCIEHNCNNKQRAKQLCRKHYQRLYRHGDSSYIPENRVNRNYWKGKKCNFHKCENNVYVKGFCNAHHQSHVRNSKKVKIKRIITIEEIKKIMDNISNDLNYHESVMQNKKYMDKKKNKVIK
jgi:hypothetical protein